MEILDYDMVVNFYESYRKKLDAVRSAFKRPLTYAEKVLYSHIYDASTLHPVKRGEEYGEFRPNRVAMQDATAQMALLQFMNAGKDRVAVPASVHCDHLIRADNGADVDLPNARLINKEVYDFLRSASQKYHIGFWAPGAGIIHQVVLENYAFPGGMMVGTDSHTPNAGGLSMIAIGVGGADAVDVLTGQPWELKIPRIIGVHLTGSLSGWASPKDVILVLLGKLTVKGGTNSIIEYFGDGASTISATGRATICNMGAELGATCSVFPYDNQSYQYLANTRRREVAELAEAVAADLRADGEVLASPKNYYDEVIEINLSEVEPHLNGPFTPDAATPVSQMKEKAEASDFPKQVEVALIGSCTNSSYEDLSRASSVIRQALDKHLPIKAQLIINPGSEQIRSTAERDGILQTFRDCGAIIMTNACGPCIGQWNRHNSGDNNRKNTIVTSFNRNFRCRADGNPNTFAFVASPELTAAMAISGRLDFNPMIDKLTNEDGVEVTLDMPQGYVFPPKGFCVDDSSDSLDVLLNNHLFIPPSDEHKDIEVTIADNSDRLQRLQPFAPWDGKDNMEMQLLIKVKGKCTTDHISMAGPWLKYRGHLANISRNLLLGAENAFLCKNGVTKNALTGEVEKVADVALYYKEHQVNSIIVAEENYGEGSSREHAAMEPRFLGVKAVLAKSFARIHETNLKKQGVLALTFANKDDYDKIQQDDKLTLTHIHDFLPGKPLGIMITHADGHTESITVNHTYNQLQIEWFKAGSALNYAKLHTEHE